MMVGSPVKLVRVLAAILLVAAILAVGWTANNYLLQAGTTLAMSAVLCLSWNVVGWFMGYPSFATAAFFGLGAYIGGIAQNHDVPFALAWMAAAAGGAVFATLLGSILLGLRGHYFAIGTIAVVEVMREIANNWEGLTGGAIGLNVPILQGSPRAVGIFFYFAMWALVVGAFALTALISNSKFGFGLRCIRQNENAASMVGINVFRFKVAAFVISGLMVATAGAVYASMVAFVEPKDVFNVLLQVLDDGRLTDNKGRVANFKNTIIIMTTNIGSEIIQENFKKINDTNYFEVIEETKDEVLAIMRRSIRPEFINRIDEIIMFRPLSKGDIRKIVEIQFGLIKKRLSESGIKLDISDKALSRLAKMGFDPQFGARPLKRVLQREILNELSKQILAGKVNRDSRILVDMKNDVEFEFINENEAEVVN